MYTYDCLSLCKLHCIIFNSSDSLQMMVLELCHNRKHRDDTSEVPFPTDSHTSRRRLPLALVSAVQLRVIPDLRFRDPMVQTTILWSLMIQTRVTLAPDRSHSIVYHPVQSNSDPRPKAQASQASRQSSCNLTRS